MSAFAARAAALVCLVPVSLWAAQGADDAKYEDVLQKLLGTLGAITKTLEGVTDADTAKAAHPELRKHAEEFRTTRKQSEDVAPPSPEARERVSKKYQPEFEKARKDLVAQVARVQRVPGGTAALQEIRSVFDRKAQ